MGSMNSKFSVMKGSNADVAWLKNTRNPSLYYIKDANPISVFLFKTLEKVYIFYIAQ